VAEATGSSTKREKGYRTASLTDTLHQPRLDDALISNFEFQPVAHSEGDALHRSSLMISISASLYIKDFAALFDDPFKKKGKKNI
jgi:hypothetical protein